MLLGYSKFLLLMWQRSKLVRSLCGSAKSFRWLCWAVELALPATRTELLRQSAEHCVWSPLQHAYYLDVQNRRPEYISTFVNELINWDKVWLQHVRVCVFQREALPCSVAAHLLLHQPSPGE